MAILECKGLCKSYGAEPALDRVDLSVEPGHIVGLLGPNGSGKSTLIKLANGLLTPDAGEILIDGKSPCRETKKIVSYLPERTYFADWMTALQLLAFFGDFYDDFDRGAAVQMMQRLGIQPKQQIKQMSKGTREKVQLILVMSRKAKLYLLDEPIASLDVSIQAGIINLLEDLQAKLKISYLFVAHDLAVIRHISDRVAVMYLGQVVELGETEDVFTHPRHPYTQALLSAIPCPTPWSSAPASASSSRETCRLRPRSTRDAVLRLAAPSSCGSLPSSRRCARRNARF